jgi:Transposase DDE domain group 1
LACSGSGEVLHVRQRKGQAGSPRGALRFVQELIARVRRAGAGGEIVVRADSAFWNKKVMAYLSEQGCRYSIGIVLQRPVLERIAASPDDAWEALEDYPDTGGCQLAETSLPRPLALAA